MKTIARRLLWAWRIWWGLCPICNSDAPEMDTCECCRGWRGYPLTDAQRCSWVEYLHNLEEREDQP